MVKHTMYSTKDGEKENKMDFYTFMNILDNLCVTNKDIDFREVEVYIKNNELYIEFFKDNPLKIQINLQKENP